MAKADPRDFLLNTDYEMDKIIYFQKFEWTASTMTTVEVAHNLPTAPLIFGVWSTNPDYTDSNEIGEANNPWDQALQIRATVDLEKITFTLVPAMQDNAYVTTKFYAMVFGFEPGSDWYDPYSGEYLKLTGHKLPPTSKYAKAFIVNTDYNYLKLYKSGNLGTWQTDHSEYTHGLGYTPQILSWDTLGPWGPLGENIEFYVGNGQFTYYVTPSINYSSGVFVDDQKIYRYVGTVPNSSEVRIYCDEA